MTDKLVVIDRSQDEQGAVAEFDAVESVIGEILRLPMNHSHRILLAMTISVAAVHAAIRLSWGADPLTVPELCQRYADPAGLQERYSAALRAAVPGLKLPDAFSSVDNNSPDDLQSSDLERERQAYAAIKSLGPKAMEAYVRGLVAATRKKKKVEDFEDEHHRIQAVRALSVMGADARAAIPALIDTVDSATFRDEYYGICASKALFALGRTEAGACGLARIVAIGYSPGIRALETLKQWGPKARPAVPQLLKLRQKLESHPIGVDRVGVEHALEIIGADPQILPDLVQLLKSSDSSDRRLATVMVGTIGPAAVSAVPLLLSEADGAYPIDAANALGAIGPGAKAAIPVLRDSLLRQYNYAREFERRLRVSVALCKIQGSPEPGVQQIVALIRDWQVSYPERLDAAWALAEIGPLAQKAVPSLLDGLKHPLADDPWRTAAVASALGHIGPSAREALPILRDRSKSGDAEIRAQSALAIWRITQQPAESIALLTDLLEHDAADANKARAVAALGEMGPAAKPALPALHKAYEADRKKYPLSVSEAAIALWRVLGHPPI